MGGESITAHASGPNWRDRFAAVHARAGLAENQQGAGWRGCARGAKVRPGEAWGIFAVARSMPAGPRRGDGIRQSTMISWVTSYASASWPFSETEYWMVCGPCESGASITQ